MSKETNNHQNQEFYFPKLLGNFLIENGIFAKEQGDLSKTQKFQELKNFYFNELAPKDRKECFENFMTSLSKEDREFICDGIARHVEPKVTTKEGFNVSYKQMAFAVMQCILGVAGADPSRGSPFPTRFPTHPPTSLPSFPPTTAPSVSIAPSTSISVAPSTSPAPSISVAPSTSPAPSISVAPSTSPAQTSFKEMDESFLPKEAYIGIGVAAVVVVVVGLAYKYHYDARNRTEIVDAQDHPDAGSLQLRVRRNPLSNVEQLSQPGRDVGIGV